MCIFVNDPAKVIFDIIAANERGDERLFHNRETLGTKVGHSRYFQAYCNRMQAG